MDTMKQAASTIAATLLPLVLFSFGVFATGYMFFSSPTPVKQAAQDSGLYESIVNNVLTDAQETPVIVGNTNITADPQVQDLVRQALPAEELQKQTEAMLDTTFAWIHGERNNLDFNLNLGNTQEQLANNVGTYINETVSQLPVCQSGQAPNPNNILQSDCRPPHVSAADLSHQARSQILQNGELSSAITINQDDLRDEQGQTLEQQLATIPGAYTFITQAAITTGILAIVLIAAAIFLHPNRARGLKRVGVITIVIGGLSAVLAVLVGYTLGRLIDDLIARSGSATGQLHIAIPQLLQLVIEDIRNWWLGYGLALVVLGIGSLVAVRILRGRAPTRSGGPMEQGIGAGGDSSQVPEVSDLHATGSKKK